MDGTLVDNSAVHIQAFEIFCARYGVRDWREKLSQAFGMGNDDIMRRIKPDPEIYLTAAAALELTPAECVVFEDAKAGIEAARRAGARRIVTLSTTLPREVLAAETAADLIIDNFAEIADLGTILQ